MDDVVQETLAAIRSQPFGTVFRYADLRQAGSIRAVGRALGVLVDRGQVMNAGRGLFVATCDDGVVRRGPVSWEILSVLASRAGVAFVPEPAAAKNLFGLSRRVPLDEVYLTSGCSMDIRLPAGRILLVPGPAWVFGVPYGRARLTLSVLHGTPQIDRLPVLARILPLLSPANRGVFRALDGLPHDMIRVLQASGLMQSAAPA